ncbi:MAG TPA: hypothetical protein VFE78_08900 [Gemmataceae bacterium]|nr:hypothetical protein [Gemmataceae bacterium]
MSVMIMMYLFGKPGQELDEGEEVTPRQLRALAESLHGRLTEAADIVEKLTAAGWDAQMTLYDISLSHPYINTAAQAEEKLLDLGIDPKLVCIDEWEDEEEMEGPEDFAEGDDQLPF